MVRIDCIRSQWASDYHPPIASSLLPFLIFFFFLPFFLPRNFALYFLFLKRLKMNEPPKYAYPYPPQGTITTYFVSLS